MTRRYVWLDDSPERDPGDEWLICRTAEEAIEALSTGEVDIISLDHDLAEFKAGREITGMEVVYWMIEELVGLANDVLPALINIHSLNCVAAMKMARTLNAYAPSSVKVTMWGYNHNLARDLVGELPDWLKERSND